MGAWQCYASTSFAEVNVSNHLAKKSPRNNSRMKDTSEAALVFPENLTDQFLGQELMKMFQWKRAEDELQLEGAVTP